MWTGCFRMMKSCHICNFIDQRKSLVNNKKMGLCLYMDVPLSSEHTWTPFHHYRTKAEINYNSPQWFTKCHNLHLLITCIKIRVCGPLVLTFEIFYHKIGDSNEILAYFCNLSITLV